MKKRRKLIIVVIVLMLIGFAAVTTSLQIFGKTSVRTNESDFDVYFSKVYLNGVEHNEFITSDGKKINFGEASLKNVGEEVELKYEITNASSQYDADINLLFSNLENNSEYLEITKEDNYNGYIEAHGSGEGIILIRLIKPLVEDETADIDLGLEVIAKEKEEDTIKDPDYTPDEPKQSDYSLYGIVIDENEEILQEKVLAIIGATGLRIVETDLEGYFYQDNLPQGTVDVYLFDGVTTDQVGKMSLEEMKVKSSRNITVTTSSKGRRDGNKMSIVDTVAKKTNELKTVSIRYDNKVVRKAVENGKVEFKIETNSQSVEIIDYGLRTINFGPNLYNITKENEAIEVNVNNVRPTSPELTGGSENYIKESDATITLAKEGSALSKVAYYEYIVSESAITDFTNKEVTGMTNREVAIAKEGKTYVYYRTVSNKGVKSEWSRVCVVSLDVSSPEVSVIGTTTTSNSIEIKFKAEDKYSGLKELTCKYGDSYESTGLIENGVCKLNSLESNKTYKYQICASDNVGNEDTCVIGEAGTREINNPKITFDSVTGATGEYYLSQTAHVEFSGENVTTPTYYIKSGRKGIASASVLESCGNGASPGACTAVNTTELTKDTWYRVSGSINITYNESSDEYASLVAITYDGVNYSGRTTGTIGKIAYHAVDLEYKETNVQAAIDDLYTKLR